MIYYNNYFVGEVEFASKVVSKEKKQQSFWQSPQQSWTKAL